MSRQVLAMLLILVPLALLVGGASYLAWEGSLNDEMRLLTAVMNVCTLASVSLLVAAAFSQPGEIRMSAERASALATGHADRSTVFESLWTRPLMWLLLLLAHRLAMPSIKDWLRR